MSVHSNHYDDPEEYRRDLQYEYRQEQWEQDHGIEAFCTDDADKPHYRCENCKHCKLFNARKPIIAFMKYVDDEGYVHNNPDKPTRDNLYARWSYENEYIPSNLCELTNNQMMDDDYCEDFEEV